MTIFASSFTREGLCKAISYYRQDEMNVKFKMPKFGRKLSGKAWWKELMMTVIATTISIVLTFGTAAWLDNRKEESARRELVMMILHDMDMSLTDAHKSDSSLQRGYECQLVVAEHPEEYAKAVMNPIIPASVFHSTTEEIVSSSIETINTIGNVLFVENVSSFYLTRKMYEENVVKAFRKDLEGHSIMTDRDDFMKVDYILYSFISSNYLLNMDKCFSQCKKMMKVSDGDLQEYWRKRMEVEREYHTDSLELKLQEELMDRTGRLREAKMRGKGAKD